MLNHFILRYSDDIYTEVVKHSNTPVSACLFKIPFSFLKQFYYLVHIYKGTCIDFNSLFVVSLKIEGTLALGGIETILDLHNGIYYQTLQLTNDRTVAGPRRHQFV